MPSLFGIYEMSRQSLLSYQAVISTVGHNVANAGNDGFHRQRVELRAGPTLHELFGFFGTGVRVDNVQRIEDRFIEAALQRELPVLARYASRSEALGQAELVFGEPSEHGLTTFLDEFFDGWDDLASNPEDSGARESVVRLGAALAQGIQEARGRLEEQRRAIDGEITRTVEEANRLIRELELLNRQIILSASSGGVAPDLEDRRDLLADTLAGLCGASATVEEDGTVVVRLAGRVVVQRETSTPISVLPSEPPQLALGDEELRTEEFDGRLGGLLEVRDVDLAEAIRRLDEFAVRLAEDVNALHEAGVDARGHSAGAFFTFTRLEADRVTGAAAGIEVSGALLEDAVRVAAGSTAKPGDNEIALELAALRDDTEGAPGMLRNLVVHLGSLAREAMDLEEGQRIVVESFRAQRESVSGVSLDEEAARLLAFQRAYQAAAQVLAAADELTETLLSL